MGLGIDDAPVIPFDEEEDPKSFSHSVTLEEDTSDPDRIKKVLLLLSEKVSRRMRKEGFYGKEDRPHPPLLGFLHLPKAEDPLQMVE